MKNFSLLHLLSFILILGFLAALSTLYHFPIYPDEIGEQIWFARTGFDMPLRLNIYPACQSFIQPLHAIWYLPGFILWLTYGHIDSLHTLRLIGLFFYFGIILLLAAHLIRSLPKQHGFFKNSLLSLGMVISLLSMGVVPFFFVTNRPEQIILLGLICLLSLSHYIFSLNQTNQPISRLKFWSLSAIFFFLISLMLYIHPKTFFLVPLFSLLAYQIFSTQKNRCLIFLLFLILAMIFLGNYQAWKNALNCTAAPVLNLFLKRFTIDPHLLMKPEIFIATASQSFDHMYFLMAKILFHSKTEINYLPSIEMGKNEDLVNYLINFSYISIISLLIVGLAYGYFKDIRNKKYLSLHLILACTLLCLFTSALFDLVKAWYGAAYSFSMISIVTIFYFAENGQAFLKKKVFHVIFFFLAMTSLFSLYTLHKNYYKPLVTGFAGPSLSLKHFNYKKFEEKMSRISQVCQIDPKLNQGIMLDDYTYLYYKKTKLPLLITYINYGNTDQSIFFSLLKKKMIQSVVIRCSQIEMIQELKSEKAKRIEDVCCFSESDIKQLLHHLQKSNK